MTPTPLVEPPNSDQPSRTETEGSHVRTGPSRDFRDGPDAAVDGTDRSDVSTPRAITTWPTAPRSAASRACPPSSGTSPRSNTASCSSSRWSWSASGPAASRRGSGSLDGRAGQARRDRGFDRAGRRRAAPQPPGRHDLHRVRQGHRAARDRRVHRCGHRHLRRRADSQPAPQSGGAAQGQGRRPHRADPGHLRAARAVQGGQGAGRARPAELPGTPAAGLGCRAVPAAWWPGRRRRRHRIARSR